MAYISRKTVVENSYRKVEAMYRKGADVNTIANALDLSKLEVLDTIQKIFALDMQKKSRAV